MGIDPVSKAFRIKIFMDGADIEPMKAAHKAGTVKGFTTNPTLMRKSGITDYAAFAKAAIARSPTCRSPSRCSPTISRRWRPRRG